MRLPVRHLILLAALIVFHGVSNYLLISQDMLPLYRDEAHKARASLMIDEALWTGAHGGFAAAVSGLSYPPLPQLASMPLYRLFGRATIVTRMTGVLFLAVLAACVYGIAASLQSPGAGLLAAFTVTMFPQIFGHARIYMTDLPLTAVTALTICMLVLSRHLHRVVPAVGFALSLGVGLLAKWTYPVFVAGPVCLDIVRSLWLAGSRGRRRRQRALRTVAILVPFALAGLSVAALWYLHARQAYLHHITEAMGLSNLRGLQEKGPLEYVLYYFRDFYRVQILDGYLLLFGASLLVLWTRRPKETRWILAWVVVPYLFFTFVVEQNKSPRYLMPVLPAMAVSISLAVFSIRKKTWRTLAVWFVIGFGLIQYGVLCYHPGLSRIFEHLGPREEYLVEMTKEEASMEPSFSFFIERLEMGLIHPNRLQWCTRDVIEALEVSLAADPNPKRAYKLYLLTDRWTLSVNSLLYCFRLYGIEDITVDSFHEETWGEVNDEDEGDRQRPNPMEDVDFVVLSTPDYIMERPVRFRNIYEEFQKNITQFSHLGTYELPSRFGIEIRLFRRLEGA